MQTIEVRQKGKSAEKAAHALVNFQADEVILTFRPKAVLSAPGRFTLQVGVAKHIQPVPQILLGLNHSCNPNVCFDTVEMKLIALRAIDAGEELTFFYPSTEWSMADGFRCDCSSERCLGYIDGAASLPPAVLSNYKFSPHIEQMLQTQ